MPCEKSAVVWRKQCKRLYLVVEEAERLDIRETLPEGRIDIVAVQRVSLDHRECECEDKDEVQSTEKSKRVVGFPENRCECNGHDLATLWLEDHL